MNAVRPASKGELIVFSYTSQDRKWWSVGLVAKVDRDGYATHYKKPGSNATHAIFSTDHRYVVSREHVDMDRLQTELDFNLPYPNLDQARDAVAKFKK